MLNLSKTLQRIGVGMLAASMLFGSACATSNNWKLAFSDSGTENWVDNWFVEGTKATVSNSESGLVFSAGPVPYEQASHAVLWTKQSFAGDVKIEYDYTRIDDRTDVTGVNILYVQATGLGTKECPTDILRSTAQREVPWMKSYFLNMHALHISYSTTGPKRSHYVAARRYPAKELNDFLHGTQIQPLYQDIDLFKQGQTYHITAIKQGNHLKFTAERNGQIHSFEWDLSTFPAVTEGRIGLRHMWTRSSRYEDIKVYVKE